MKKVINGKMYNTETATEIANTGNGLSSSDFNNESETLYLTKKGSWFLHGKGGANSKYCEVNGRERWGSEDIILLSKEEALQWSENNKIKSIEKYFSTEIEEG